MPSGNSEREPTASEVVDGYNHWQLVHDEATTDEELELLRELSLGRMRILEFFGTLLDTAEQQCSREVFRTVHPPSPTS